jgi:glycosyltransferase involved in cell wall biosynthesis
LTAVLTHPVQYYAPWFRYIAKSCPEIDLTVLYATQPTAEQQGVGFGRAFLWDVPLTDGYRSRVVRPAAPRGSLQSDRFWSLDVPEIGAAIRESEPEVVLLPGWQSITLLRALWACRRASIPLLYRGDSHLGSTSSGWRQPARLLRAWLLLRLFDGYLSVGQRSREYLRRLGRGEARIFDAPHCVDNEFFARSAAQYQAPSKRALARASLDMAAEDFVVLFVGKLEPKKRPLDLIRALARMKPGASLLAVGSGELEPACRAEAQKLGIRTGWPGFLNQSELGRAYAAADCLVLPSDWGETWGLVVNEALATGLPCVVSDRVGCAPDLVTPGVTGEIFPMGDVEALAGALERIRVRRNTGHDWSAACRARAADYSFERATEGLLAACRAVTRRRSPRTVAPRVVACCGGMVTVTGLERMNVEVLRVLIEHGAAVHCIVNSWENHRIVALAEQLEATWSTGPYRYRLDRHTRNPVYLARVAWDVGMTSAGLLRDAWRFRATHVLVPEHGAVVRNAPALALLRATGTRVVLNMQNAPPGGAFYRRLWRYVINPLVDHFVCCSSHTRRELLSHGIPENKTSLIHNVAPRRSTHTEGAPDRDVRRIIYVGQIIPEKGLDLLLEAAALLVARGYDPRIVVVGTMDGWVAPAYTGYREALRSRASAPDLKGRVEFLGWREDVPALLAGAAIHCCPSRPEMREGLPLVCLEAKQAGLPSVVLPVGPFPEIISHAVDGWICSEAGVQALADGLEYFLSDPERTGRAGAAAKASADRFSRERFADAWWDVFRTGRRVS